jgi:hypothetical protein
MPPRRKNRFNAEMQKAFTMFRCGKTVYEAICRTCDSTIDVGNKGRTALVQHIKTASHLSRSRASDGSQKLTVFTTVKNTELQARVSAAEATLAYHTVKHGLSFKTSDCTSKLCNKLFSDSEIGKKLSSARTKTEAIVVKVLAPHSVEQIIKDVQDVPYLGVATDASNHGYTKVFPVVIQYFTIEEGLNVKLLRVDDLKNEKSKTITEYLMDSLEKHQLSIKCVAFCGDNCNTNFGGVQRNGRNNVFHHLKDMMNPKIIGVGCPIHILHNATEHGFFHWVINIDTVVLKLYNYFKQFTIRVELLKEFCDFINQTFADLLSHSKTRWLSLYPAVDRILQMWGPLRSYFLSVEKVPVLLKEFFENELNEGYLWFVHSLMFVFNQKTKLMETEKNSLIEVIDILVSVEEILEERIKSRFLPLSVKSIFRKFGSETDEVRAMETKLLASYDNILEYLHLWTSQLNDFKVFSWMSLKNEPVWDDIEKTIIFLQTKGVIIDDNVAINQLVTLKNFVAVNHEDKEYQELLAHEKWKRFLKLNRDCDATSQFLIMCQYFFAIPAQNANLERIFSLMQGQWTKERNRLLIENVAGILLVIFNFKDWTCLQFLEYISTQNDLLLKVCSSAKYE